MAEEPVFNYRTVTDLAWSSDGELLAISREEHTTASEGDTSLVSIFQMESGQLVRDFTFSDTYVDKVRWRSNDQVLMIVTSMAAVKRFDVASGAPLNEWSVNSLLSSFDAHPVAQVVALGLSANQEQVLEIRDEIDGTLRQRFIISTGEDEFIFWVGWSADGSKLALLLHTGDAYIYQWDGQNVSLLRTFRYLEAGSRAFLSVSGAWGSDHNSLAIGMLQHRDSQLQYVPRDASIYNTETGIIIRSLPNSEEILALSWSQETNLLAGRVPRAIRYWNPENGQLLEEKPINQDISTLAWSSKGVLAMGTTMTFEKWIEAPNRDDELSYIVLDRSFQRA